MIIDNIRPIRTDADLSWAIGEVERYFDDEPEPGTEAALRFECLANMIEKYEDEHYPMGEVDPVRMLHAAIDGMGRSQTELAALIGRTRASEILGRKRKLTLDMIRTISREWHLPVAALIADYELAPTRAPNRPKRVRATTPPPSVDRGMRKRAS